MNSLTMIITNRTLILISVVCWLMVSCDQPGEEAVCLENQMDVSDVEINLQYESLTSTFLNIQTKEELANFLNDNPIIREVMLHANEYPSEAIFYEELFNKITNPHIDTLAMEIERVFGNEEELKNDFTRAFQHLKYYYPDVTIPKVKTIATGFDQDLYVSDSLIVVGLDYYLGDNAKYRPLGTYQYILERYRPQYVVPSTMLIYGISPRFNATEMEDKTILGEMISYGKAFYFAKHMMPCTPDSVLIWYNQEEMTGVRENEKIIWAHFVENELLFETSHEMKRKYIEERPKTYEIGNAAPGRIGTWLGWRLVRSYMEENETVSLPQLMNNQNAKAIFENSNYKPQ